MCKIKFFRTHELLLQEKLKPIIQINKMLKRAKDDYDDSLNIIGGELGIQEKDLKKWMVSQDQKGLEKNPNYKELKEN